MYLILFSYVYLHNDRHRLHLNGSWLFITCLLHIFNKFITEFVLPLYDKRGYEGELNVKVEISLKTKVIIINHSLSIKCKYFCILVKLVRRGGILSPSTLILYNFMSDLTFYNLICYSRSQPFSSSSMLIFLRDLV